MDPDRIARLEEERSFLLRSIVDLDAERAAGDVDLADHQALRDGYVGRAAAVLRELDGERPQVSTDRPRGRRRWAWIAVTALVAVGAGVLVANIAAPRQPGQTISGGLPSDRAVQGLARASELLSAGDLEGARLAYVDVLSIDPGNLEALTYEQWTRVVQSTSASTSERSATIDEARQTFSEVADRDPTYADPRCFLAVIEGSDTFNPQPDLPAAATAAERCLAANPPNGMRQLVTSFLIDVGGPALTTTLPGP